MEGRSPKSIRWQGDASSEVSWRTIPPCLFLLWWLWVFPWLHHSRICLCLHVVFSFYPCVFCLFWGYLSLDLGCTWIAQDDLISRFFTSAKKLSPNKVTFPCSRCQDIDIPLWGPPFNPPQVKGLYVSSNKKSWVGHLFPSFLLATVQRFSSLGLEASSLHDAWCIPKQHIHGPGRKTEDGQDIQRRQANRACPLQKIFPGSLTWWLQLAFHPLELDHMATPGYSRSGEVNILSSQPL